MTAIIEILLLAVSSNIDDLGTGFALGVKGYHPTLRFRLTVAAFSGISMFAGMILGETAVVWLPHSTAAAAGAAVFALCALWFGLEAAGKIKGSGRPNRTGNTDDQDYLGNPRPNGSLTRLHLTDPKPVGLRGGIIFGAALGLDSFFLGIPAGLAGFPAVVTASAAGLGSFAVVTLGSCWGARAGRRIGPSADLWAVGLLVLLAVMQLI